MLFAGVAHLVERHLAKVEVAGSSPVARSRKKIRNYNSYGFFLYRSICGAATARRIPQIEGLSSLPCAGANPAALAHSNVIPPVR